MEIIGIGIPLWGIFLIGIIAVIVAWKLVKFAIKIALVLIVFFAILIGLDFFDVFSNIQNFFSMII